MWSKAIDPGLTLSTIHEYFKAVLSDIDIPQ